MKNEIVLLPVSMDELENRLVSRFKALFSERRSAPEALPAEDYITVKQAAKLLQVSTVTIHKWKTDGKLKFYRFGTRIRFKQSEIENLEKYKK